MRCESNVHPDVLHDDEWPAYAVQASYVQAFAPQVSYRGTDVVYLFIPTEKRKFGVGRKLQYNISTSSYQLVCLENDVCYLSRRASPSDHRGDYRGEADPAGTGWGGGGGGGGGITDSGL